MGSNHSHLPKHGTVLFNRNGGALSIRALEMLHFVGSLVIASNCCTFASGQQSLQRSSLLSKGRMILACSPDLSYVFLRSEKWNTCNQLTSKCGMNSMNPWRDFSKSNCQNVHHQIFLSQLQTLFSRVPLWQSNIAKRFPASTGGHPNYQSFWDLPFDGRVSYRWIISLIYSFQWTNLKWSHFWGWIFQSRDLTYAELHVASPQKLVFWFSVYERPHIRINLQDPPRIFAFRFLSTDWKRFLSKRKMMIWINKRKRPRGDRCSRRDPLQRPENGMQCGGSCCMRKIALFDVVFVILVWILNKFKIAFWIWQKLVIRMREGIHSNLRQPDSRLFHCKRKHSLMVSESLRKGCRNAMLVQQDPGMYRGPFISLYSLFSRNFFPVLSTIKINLDISGD